MFLKAFTVNLRGSVGICSILNANSRYGIHASSSRIVQIIANTQHCPTVRYSTEKAASTRKHADKGATTNQTEQLSSEDILMLKKDSDCFGTLSNLDSKVSDQTAYQSQNDDIESKKDSFSPKKMSGQQFEALLKKLMSEKSVQEAVRVFESELQKKDHITIPVRVYEWLIDECLRFNEFNKAFSIYDAMVNRTLKVSLKTIEKIAAAFETTESALKKVNNLRKVIAKCKDEPTQNLYNILIRIYMRSNQCTTGFELADEMVQRGFHYDLDTITMMFNGCSLDKNKGFVRLIELWHEMHRLGYTPNLFTINAFLRAVHKSELNDVEKLKQMLSTIQAKCTHTSQDIDSTTDQSNIEHEIDDGRPNLLAVPPTIGHLFPLENVKQPEDRLLILGGFTGLLKVFKSAQITPNLETIASLLNVIPNTFVAQQKVISMMQKHEIVPDINLFHTLLMKTCLRQDFRNAQVIIIRIILIVGFFYDFN